LSSPITWTLSFSTTTRRPLSKLSAHETQPSGGCCTTRRRDIAPASTCTVRWSLEGFVARIRQSSPNAPVAPFALPVHPLHPLHPLYHLRP
jgi:hypothetical protein